MRAGKCLIPVFLLILEVLSCEVTGATPFEGTAAGVPRSRVDEIVFARLNKLGITPAQPCSDPVFIRRVFLDVTGTLPAASEAQQFIFDPSPGKRAALIERLLARDEFADYFAMKWSDVLRIKAEFPVNLWPNAAQGYHHWIRDSIRDNIPWDRVAREMLTASGSNFQNPPVNFYRALQNKTPSGIAQSVALTFMGERTEHWPSNDLANLVVFFSNVSYKSTAEWKEEIVFYDPAATNAGALDGTPRKARFPDGSRVTLTVDRDSRVVFADWLVKSPQFSRSLVNRTWYWLLGRGIVHEPDDFRPDNPPLCPELLDYLSKEFAGAGYDFKKLCRLILNSQVYQLASIPGGGSNAAVENFGAYPLRRLDAEVLIDVVDQLTGSSEKYTSTIPEPYTVIPEHIRSVALPDGSITSPFLEMFGRPPRATGHASERNDRITAAQKLWLVNSSAMLKKIEQSRMVEFQASGKRTPQEIVTGIYLGILSRLPTSGESAIAQRYFQSGVSRRQAVVDLAWALMNTTEFLYRH